MLRFMGKMILLLALFNFFTGLEKAQASNGVWSDYREVQISSGIKPVKLVHADLSDPGIEVRPVVANDTVGTTEELASMAGRAGAVAAINGTFFNAYSDMLPHGTIEAGGQHLHLGGNGTTVGFTGDNRVVFRRLKPEITGGINGSRDWPNNWYAWGFNHPYTDPSAIEIYTPAFGSTIKPPYSAAVVVEYGKVARIGSGPVAIPENGYVIGFGPAVRGDAAKFKVGDSVSYRLSFTDDTGAPVEWSGVRNALSAGPLLVSGGEIALDFGKDGMDDPKITSASGARSFIGVDGGGILVMGTVPAATVWELAQVAKGLGLVEAMNLDGGASSGLYFNGEYLTAPGRKLSNCLAIVRGAEPPVKIVVNGSFVHGLSPYVAPPGVTMVPVRGVLERIGAKVDWEPSTQTVTAALGGNRIVLKIGSASAEVNGMKKTMLRPAELMNSRTYIPVRFFAENLGAKVNWDAASSTVRVDTN